jgi:retinol dehydrogenase-12
MDHYSVTKLLNYFWGVELASRIPRGEITINLFNPGSVNTELHRNGGVLIQQFDRYVGRTSEEGGRLVVDAAVVKATDTHGMFLSEAKVYK